MRPVSSAKAPRVRTVYRRREGGYRHQECHQDNTTSILRKDDHRTPVKTRRKSREDRSPRNDREECLGSHACCLCRPLSCPRIQSLRWLWYLAHVGAYLLAVYELRANPFAVSVSFFPQTLIAPARSSVW